MRHTFKFSNWTFSCTLAVNLYGCNKSLPLFCSVWISSFRHSRRSCIRDMNVKLCIHFSFFCMWMYSRDSSVLFLFHIVFECILVLLAVYGWFGFSLSRTIKENIVRLSPCVLESFCCTKINPIAYLKQEKHTSNRVIFTFDLRTVWSLLLCYCVQFSNCFVFYCDSIEFAAKFSLCAVRES